MFRLRLRRPRQGYHFVSMSHFLVTNDDGVDSPALLPLIAAMEGIGAVETVVPDRERSWIAKAITRRDPVRVDKRDIEGHVVHTATGFPADCVQLGLHSLFDALPELVVSGINVGYNYGSAYLLSSGTVGAATEGWIGGVPAVAVSAGTSSDWPTWARFALSAESREMWERLAAVAVDVIADVLESDVFDVADVVSINLPDQADLDTPRRVTRLARVGYDRLFAPTGEGVYSHHYGGGIVEFEAMSGTDIATAGDGEVAITPLVMARAADVSDELRRRLERS